MARRILKRYAISVTPKAQALSTPCRRADLPSRRAARRANRYPRLVELQHIEQGCVSGEQRTVDWRRQFIVGQRRYTVTLNGESNHAGTTPWAIVAIRCMPSVVFAVSPLKKAKQHGDPRCITFGKVEPQPNTVNAAVPGNHIYNRLPAYGRRAAVLREFTEQLKRYARYSR